MTDKILITGLNSGDPSFYNDAEKRKRTRQPVKIYIDPNDICSVVADGDSIRIATSHSHLLWIYYNDDKELDAVFNKLINHC